jgi:hypothetical protein
MGFAGAQTEGKFVLLAGVAGLLAGAFSMAAGEYVSMRAQRELFERQIELERGELEAAPEEEQRELALIYQAKGLPKEQAEAMAARLMENPEVALDTLVREELGLDPAALGSPWGASTALPGVAAGALTRHPFLFSANASTPFVVASAALAAWPVRRRRRYRCSRACLPGGGRQLPVPPAAALTFGEPHRQRLHRRLTSGGNGSYVVAPSGDDHRLDRPRNRGARPGGGSRCLALRAQQTENRALVDRVLRLRSRCCGAGAMRERASPAGASVPWRCLSGMPGRDSDLSRSSGTWDALVPAGRVVLLRFTPRVCRRSTSRLGRATAEPGS